MSRQVEFTKSHGFPMFHIPDTFIQNAINLTSELEATMSSNHLQNLEGESDFKQLFIKRIYKGDVHGHLGWFAHTLIASYSLTVLEILFCYSQMTAHMNHTSSTMTPIYVSKTALQLYLEADPYLVTACNVHQRGLFHIIRGFTVATDMPGRPVGFLSNNTGDFLSLVVPVYQHHKFGIITIEYLASYNLMGAMEVSIAPVKLGEREVAYLEIDCLWNKTESIISSTTIALNRSEYYNGDLFLYSIEINITVKKFTPSRQSNKIKIFNFLIY